jgi:hypothetical protein
MLPTALRLAAESARSVAADRQFVFGGQGLRMDGKRHGEEGQGFQ